MKRGNAVGRTVEAVGREEQKMKCEHNGSIACNCTASCGKRGKCCECVAYHRSAGEFPACFFSAEAEKKYDRSLGELLRDREG